MPRVRRIAQALFLGLFLAALAGPLAEPVGKLLFRLDLLTGGAYLAVRWAAASALFLLVLLLVTFFLGRVFCGWACPQGALIDACDALLRQRLRGTGARRVKYHLLILLACLAAGGLTVAWAFDPLNWAARIGAPMVWGTRAAGWFLTGAVLTVGLELFLGRRGICRIICPLGALLGTVARFSLFRREVSSSCTECGACTRGCRMAALGEVAEELDRAECIHCRDCDATCPSGALRFRYLKPRLHLPRSGRREYLASLAGGAALAAGYAWWGRAAVAATPPLRPPGSVAENDLESLCIRCGACLRVCPTGTLVPARDGARPRAWETPVFAGRQGGCLYDCNACGEVCPTGAIQSLPLARKRREVIGAASFDETRCLPYVRGEACLACYAACPFEAIALKTSSRRTAWGDPLLLPDLRPGRCVGCALCETSCIVSGEAAVRVAPVPESQRQV